MKQLFLQTSPIKILNQMVATAFSEIQLTEIAVTQLRQQCTISYSYRATY